MAMKCENGWWVPSEEWAFRLLWVSVFTSAFSLPTGRVFLLMSMLALIWRAVAGRGRIAFPATAWCWLVFALVALVVSAFGVNPALSFRKINKLVWFMGIPVAATLATTRDRVQALLKAYVFGAGVLALDILVLRTWSAWQTGRAAGGEMDLWWLIIDRGSMTHGQILMVALTGMAGLLTIGFHQRRLAEPVNAPGERAPSVFHLSFAWGMLAAITAALLINFKRGSWAAAGIVMVALLALTGRRWRVVALIAGVAVLALLPPVQRRVADLRSELSLGHGGRLVMWTRIAPTLIREHPFGIGYRALDERLMQETARRLDVRVEQNRNHLHSNPLQILVSTGWAGLAVYLVWMGIGIYRGIRVRSASGDFTGRTLGLTLTLMLLGLVLNGLVEYNFGDAELILAYGLLFGMLESRGPAWRQSAGRDQ
jgi:O-antigen ligase